ncbi:12871_t:CDS:10 [Gigaspora margarita]|uniref:12871_t:CDS:1 n=1 Tax=Gigaspora margarita TaxID=4874 RepID=A0ABM8W2F9_GIGMA|nr:12871_t:CDS:10 [Gigaspora margarita]
MSSYYDNSYEKYLISPSKDINNAKSDKNTTVEHDPRAYYFDNSYEEFPIMSVDIVKSDNNTIVEYNNNSCTCGFFPLVTSYCDDSYKNFPIGLSESVENVKSDDNAAVEGYCSDNYEEFSIGPSRSADNIKSDDNTIADSNDNPAVKCNYDPYYCDNSHKGFLIDSSRSVDNTAIENNPHAYYYDNSHKENFPIGPSRSVDNIKSDNNTIAKSNDNPAVKCNNDLHACSLVANYCDDSYKGFPIDPSRSGNNTAIENNLCACYCDSYKKFLIDPSRSVNNITVKNNLHVCSFLNPIMESIDNTIGANINNPAVKCNDNSCACSFIPLANLIIESFCVNDSYKEFLDDNTTVESTKLQDAIYSIQLTNVLEIWELSEPTANTNTNYTVDFDLHILDQFRALYTFTTEIRQHVQKKSQKKREYPPTKHIKSLAENISHHGGTKTSVSAINPNDPNLYIRNTNMKLRSNGKTTIQQMQNVYHLSELVARTLFYTINNNLNETSAKTSQSIRENAAKRKYICKMCGNSDYNSRKCNSNK